MKKSSKITEAKHGDQVLVLRYIRVFHISDYIRFFILLFINFKYITFFQWRKICMYHHAITLCEVAGVLSVFEAVNPKFKDSGSWERYKHDKNIQSFLILRPNFHFDNLDVWKAVNLMLGKPYDYWGTCFLQMIYNLTFEVVWLGTKNLLKAMKNIYCSEGSATSLNVMSKGRYFKEPYKYSPMSLFESELLDKTY